MKLFELSKIKEKISNKIREFNKDIWGKSPLTFYFSFQGFFNRSQYFGALIILGSFLTFICSFDFLPLTIWAGWQYSTPGWPLLKKMSRYKHERFLFIIIYTIPYLSVRLETSCL